MVKMSLTRGIEHARSIFKISKAVSESLTPIAREFKADPATMSVAVMMASYTLVKFSSRPEDVERRFWECARLAKEMFELVGKAKEKDSDGEQQHEGNDHPKA